MIFTGWSHPPEFPGSSLKLLGVSRAQPRLRLGMKSDSSGGSRGDGGRSRRNRGGGRRRVHHGEGGVASTGGSWIIQPAGYLPWPGCAEQGGSPKGGGGGAVGAKGDFVLQRGVWDQDREELDRLSRERASGEVPGGGELAEVVAGGGVRDGA